MKSVVEIAYYCTLYNKVGGGDYRPRVNDSVWMALIDETELHFGKVTDAVGSSGFCCNVNMNFRFLYHCESDKRRIVQMDPHSGSF